MSKKKESLREKLKKGEESFIQLIANHIPGATCNGHSIRFPESSSVYATFESYATGDILVHVMGERSGYNRREKLHENLTFSLLDHIEVATTEKIAKAIIRTEKKITKKIEELNRKDAELEKNVEEGRAKILEMIGESGEENFKNCISSDAMQMHFYADNNDGYSVGFRGHFSGLTSEQMKWLIKWAKKEKARIEAY